MKIIKVITVITVITIHEYHLNYYMKRIFTRLILERTICSFWYYKSVIINHKNVIEYYTSFYYD